MALSPAYAVMGEKDLALKLAERELILDRAKSPLSHVWTEEHLAMIQTMVGENSRAISILTELLQKPYWSYSLRSTGHYPGASQARSALGPFARRSRFPKTLRGKAEIISPRITRITRMFGEQSRFSPNFVNRLSIRRARRRGPGNPANHESTRIELIGLSIRVHWLVETLRLIAGGK